MQPETKTETELQTKIQTAIDEITNQIREVDERKAELSASLKRHRKMLRLAKGEEASTKRDTVGQKDR